MRDQAMDRIGEAPALLPRSVRIFRERFPTARITSSLIRLDAEIAVVSVEVELADGGVSSALGSCRAMVEHAVEIAESRALERALDGLGVSVPGTLAQTPSPSTPLGPEPAAEPPPTQSPPSPPQVVSVRTEQAQAPAPVRPEATPASTAATDDPPLEDYSWTAFWNWARGHGYANRADLEQKLSVSINGMSPADVRVLIRERSGIS